MARFVLTDAEWAAVEPALPTDTRGVERVDDRRGSTASFGVCVRARPGPISQRGMDLERPAATASGGGAKPEYGIDFSMPCQWLTTAIF